MYDNDYIIAVNENGQPYIAHRVDAGGAGGRAPWGSKSGRRPLYIAKEFVNGKLRYIYERAKAGAKAGAKKAWGSKAGRWIDSHDAGISERLMSKAYGAKKRKAQKSGNKALASYYSKRQQALKYEGRREGKAAKEAVRSKYNSTKDKVKDWAGYDERERLEAANRSADISEKNYWASKNKNGPNKGEGSKTRALHDVATQQRQKARDAQSEYDRTLLGRIDSVKRRKKRR